MKILNVLWALIFCSSLSAQENYNMVVRSHLTFPGKELANIGGYVDSLGNEYALVGTTAGLSIVNVTNPDNPVMAFEVPGVNSIWREVKTWQGFAYVTTEGTNGGLTVIDLRELPAGINSHVYRGDGAILNQLSKSHSLHIDNGFLYLYGSNIGIGGVVFLGLNDPWNPTYLGKYDERYVHDGYVSGDTVWASHIYDGIFTAIDASDKTNPVTLGSQTTPGNFTHNTWLTDDHNVVLTTDEVTNSYLTSYYIDNLNNITELDRYQTAPGGNSIVHNTHVLNDYAVTSWYTEGVVIVDAARPANLIEVAKNDFTTFEGGTFNGCWGVYPFLPSGNLVASDIEGGLYVLTPTYVRGCYLEGIVRDSACGAVLDGVTVSIVEIAVSEQTGIDGTYRTGTAIPGTYTITFSKVGYDTYTLNNVNLANGVLTEFEISLYIPNSFALNGIVVNTSGDPVASALVSLADATSSIQLSSDVLGDYTKCDIQPGTFQLAIGKWGFVTVCESNFALNSNSPAVETALERGYYDDFQFNFGWTVTSTSPTGIFERALPAATTLNGALSNPGTDVSGDCNGYAYVTGNAVGAGAGTDDVDDGYTRLTSPAMDLTLYNEAYIYFHRWFFNGGGTGAVNDTLYIRMSNNGGTPVTVKKIAQDLSASQWQPELIKVHDYFAVPGQVRFIAEAVDNPNGHILEAGIDKFYVIDSFTVNTPVTAIDEITLQAFPVPAEDVVNVRWQVQEHSTNLTMRVTDISGRVIDILPILGNEGVISLGAKLPSGVYLVQLFDAGSCLKTTRIIMSH